MKFLDYHFEDYLKNINQVNLHPSMKKYFTTFPKELTNLKNIIFYGPPGVGKYTQALLCLKNYSPSNLKYEKKLFIQYNKTDYYFKISDIHFEIDMSLLGCISKLLWNEIYTNIIDVLTARSVKSGIILCKNFHAIHSELLESFYSYIQQNNKNVNIIFFLITEQISFIPECIINTCNIISFPRPSKTNYNKLANKNLSSSFNCNTITNIKNIITNTDSFDDNIDSYINRIYDEIIDFENIKFLNFRDSLYETFIYNMDVGYIIWNILKKLIENKKINKDNFSTIFIHTYSFFQYFNNNYRPIYHLENYFYKLIVNIHGL